MNRRQRKKRDSRRRARRAWRKWNRQECDRTGLTLAQLAVERQKAVDELRRAMNAQPLFDPMEGWRPEPLDPALLSVRYTHDRVRCFYLLDGTEDTRT